MNTFDIKLNEPLILSFTGPKGDVFKMTVSCDGVVVTPPTPPIPSPATELSDRAKQAAADVKQIVDIMVTQDPTALRKIGTVYYTMKLAKTYTIEAESTAFATIVGYEPAAFISVYNSATETDRLEVCEGFIYAIQTALTGKGLPGIY